VFETYEGGAPAVVPVTITELTVEKVASQLSGTAGLGGTDAVDLRNWLLQFGEESKAFREEMALWANWLGNDTPPWPAYRALMACRLVALDKQPGVRPVGIGESYRRLLAKCILSATGHHATAACDNLNLCAGLPAGIEGAVHAMGDAWAEAELNGGRTQPKRTSPTAATTDPSNGADQPYATLLVDARNGFNELSRKAALWTVRHRWPHGSRFAFNCYRHAAQLVIRRPGRPCSVILSQEGVTQGDPISMVIYGVALTPLTETVRQQLPATLQAWYADDSAFGGTAPDIAAAMRTILERGPARGYFPEPSKSILICNPAVRATVQAELAEFSFQYEDGYRHVGGFIGTPEAKTKWIQPQIQQWIKGIERLANVAPRFPQTAYAGLAKSLQLEWQYLQRVAPDVGAALAPLENAITTTFLPALIAEPEETIRRLRETTTLPVRYAGLGVPNPGKTARQNHEASRELTAPLTLSLATGEELGIRAYAIACATTRKMQQKRKDTAATDRLKRISASAKPIDARRMARAKETGAWLTVMPNSLNGTDLSADEFRDNLRIRLGLTPASLPSHCVGCNDRFTVEHAMTCKKGGLIVQRHNDLKAEWHHLCVQALTATAITDEPLIHMSRDVRQAGAAATEPQPELRGDVSAHGFWKRGTTTIFDIRVTDTDAASYRTTDPKTVLQRHEREKKAKYNNLCLARHRHFTPLVFSVDGMQGKEATAAIKKLSSHLSSKWKRTYSEVCGFTKSRLSVALARSASRCLRADRDPLINRPDTEWVAGTGLSLYR